MAVKLQINPSTGKLSFNASTGKLSVVDDSVTPGVDCSFCSVTPATISVTFTGITANNGCGYCATNLGGGGDRTLTDLPDMNGQTYVLLQTGNPCIWRNNITVSTFFEVLYSTGDGTCSGFNQGSISPDNMFVEVRRDSSGVSRVSIYNPALGGGSQFLFEVGGMLFLAENITPSSGCVGVTSAPNDQTTNDGCNVGYGGTVTIVEN